MALRGFQVPWWISASYFAGLLFVFLGERAFGHIDSASTLTWLGVIGMLGVTGVRAFTFSKAKGDSRKVEALTILTYAGGFVALALYALTTQWGIELVGLVDAEPDKIEKFTTPVTVLWVIVLIVALIPMLMIELGQGFVERGHFELGGTPDAGVVDSYRIRESATAGLTIALAMSFLFVTCQAAEEYDIRKDVSYFKTSSPGSATVAIVKSVSEPLNVYLFYPDINEVKDQLKQYFDTLGEETGGKIVVHLSERFREIELTKKFKVSKNGTIVIARGDKHEKFTITDDIKQARRKQLRKLDETVQKTLLKVVRAKRIAYLTTGHGEMNDPESVGALNFKGPRMKATLVKEALKRLNYQVKDLAPFDLTGGVPEDATMVIALAPRRSFSEQEESSLDTYLGEGGGLLLALDPRGKAELGNTLSGRLGVRYVNEALADDKSFVPQRMNASDHAFIKTNQFSAHAAVTTLSRRGSRMGIVLVRPGYLEAEQFVSKGAKRTFVVRTMTSSFNDINNNFTFDKGSEKRTRYNIAAAIEDGAAVKKNPKEGVIAPREGMRAMVVADAEVFADALLAQVPLLQDLLFDSIKWLGGEERFAGETKNEEDVKIEHSKNEDVVYFYFTICLAPAVLLALGLMVGRIRRRRIARRKASS